MNFKGRRYRTTAITKMEFLDQVTLYLSILEKKTIVLVVKARPFSDYSNFEKQDYCIGNICLSRVLVNV